MEELGLAMKVFLSSNQPRVEVLLLFLLLWGFDEEETVLVDVTLKGY